MSPWKQPVDLRVARRFRGLAVAITFGGRYTVGDGFTIPIIVRCLLQTCATVPEALARLKALPHRLAQNLLLLDRQGDHAVAFTSPEGVIIADGQACCTNHQGRIYEPRHAAYVKTVGRLEHLEAKDCDLTPADFLQPPLYNTRYADGFGTLYTAELDPLAGSVTYHWPGDQQLRPAPDSAEADLTVALGI